MKERVHILLVFASAGMMLCWFYAWNSFIMFHLSAESIHVLGGAIVLGMASVITLIHRSRGWRWFPVLLMNLAGLVLSLSLIVYMSNNFSSPYWSLDWISEFFYREKGLVEWMVIIHIVFWVVFLWICGIRLIHQRITIQLIRTRFDICLVSFLLLLLIKLVARYKGDIILYDHSIIFTFIAFIISCIKNF